VLLDQEQSENWLLKHFHPNGLKCPNCGASVDDASPFRKTKRSQLTVYRCRSCRHAYNLHNGTVFHQRHLTPAQAVLLIRGVLKSEPSNVLATKLDLHYLTVLQLCHALQANAEALQPQIPLPDLETESDEVFQNAGEKRN